MKRTTHRSRKGKKIYAVRDKRGRFKDIQTYKRAHAADLKRKARSEKAGGIAAAVLALALLFPSLASARSQRSAVDTHELAQEQCVSQTIDIDNTTPTNVLTASTDLSSSTVIVIGNVDSSKIVNVGFTSSVSATRSSANYGLEIAPLAKLVLSINRDKFAGIWAITQQTAPTRATIAKCR